MTKGKWIRWSLGAGLLSAVACAGAEDNTIVVLVGPDGSAGAAGSTGGTGASGGSGGSGATGGSGGSTNGGSGGTGGSAGQAGSAGSGGEDSGSDAATGGTGGVVDAGSDAPDYDASGPCTPNEIQTQSCGSCGSRARLCDTTGTWLDWGECTGEVGECTPGTELKEACGKCGTITYFCSSACLYLPGPCENEGICSPGELTVSNASCPAGQVRTSVCTNQCGPGSWTQCSTSYTWKPIADAPTSFVGRRYTSTAWNGTYWVIAGGYGSSPTYKEDAILYNPATDTWTPLPPWPSGFTGRERPGIVATADFILIWGGYGSSPTSKTDGIKYTFATNTWTPISTTGSPGGRSDFAYAWDEVGQQLIVFGGYSTTYTNTIHAYKPATDTWEELPPATISERRETQFAWDPVRRWLYIWGGYGTKESPTYKENGAIYDAEVGIWRALPPKPASFHGRYGGGAAVAGDRFVVFGGQGSSPTYKADGMVYDPVAHAWTILPSPPIDARTDMVALTNGTQVLFWGGREATTVLKGDGALFNPVTLQWTGVSSGALVQSPAARYGATGLWSPQGIVLWGGSTASSTHVNDGRLYVP